MARTSSKYLMNQKELEVLMNKGCKGFVTELTKVAAKKLYEQGIYTDDRSLVPVYLRASQAERERNERLGIGN